MVKYIPVFFHNLKGYDGHLIVSEIGKHTSNLSAIPQNYEKMISFSFSHLRFLDSAASLARGHPQLEVGAAKARIEFAAHPLALPEAVFCSRSCLACAARLRMLPPLR